MFKRAILFTTCLCASLVTLWIYCFAYVTPSDLIASKKNLEEKIAAAHSTSVLSTTQQNRHLVVKEIYFFQEDRTHLHYRIESDTSSLILVPKGNGFEVNEKLEKIKCWLQDKLYYQGEGAEKMQQVRFLEAEEGIYRYNTQAFLANSVDISLYRLKGHELPVTVPKESPFLHGVAEEITFGVSGKTPQFQATRFQANLYTPQHHQQRSS